MMEMEENHINFSEDWKKLKDGMFTTIRSFELAKYSYYKAQQGKLFEIRFTPRQGFRGKVIAKATLLQAIPVNGAELSDSLLDYDTDNNFKGWKDKIKSKNMVILLIFRKPVEELVKQVALKEQ